MRPSLRWCLAQANTDLTSPIRSDRLDNQEIVSLVGAHLCGVRGPQTRQAVLAHSTDPTAVSGPYASHAPRQEPTRGEGEVYTFEDGNLATHLMRNSLGGAKRKDVSVLLSIPAPLSRRYRDDVRLASFLFCLSLLWLS